MSLSPELRTQGPALSILRRSIVTGLEAPTDLAVSREGLLVYLDRRRGLFVQPAGQSSRLLFLPDEVRTGSASGMLAVALDPDFARNRWVYVLIRSASPAEQVARVVRLSLDATYTRSLEHQDIVVDRMLLRAAAAENTSAASGALRFGPDGYLYVALGGRQGAAADEDARVGGKVLRLSRQAVAAPANRRLSGHDPRVYAQGLREPVALAFHPNTETLLVAQRQGANPDDLTWVSAPGGGTLLAPGWHAARAGEGLSAVEPLRGLGLGLGEWRNAFVLAFDGAQRLDLVKFDAQGRVVRYRAALQGLGVGFKALAQGPDGLYVATSGKSGGEEIWRLSIY
ncbi:MAG: PQQ-dependent sugar dehydrogenase [Rubrivivax sp.]